MRFNCCLCAKFFCPLHTLPIENLSKDSSGDISRSETHGTVSIKYITNILHREKNRFEYERRSGYFPFCKWHKYLASHLHPETDGISNIKISTYRTHQAVRSFFVSLLLHGHRIYMHLAHPKYLFQFIIQKGRRRKNPADPIGEYGARVKKEWCTGTKSTVNRSFSFYFSVLGQIRAL